MQDFDTEIVGLGLASGRILRQVVTAERDQPPFHRVMMDGIAIRCESLERGKRGFAIQGTQLAGDPAHTLVNEDNCIEVMTGAVLPEEANCIIPVERISVQDKMAIIEEGYQARANQFIHPQGSDHRQGQEVLQPGAPVSPMDIAIIASCGLDAVQVSRSPVVRVISTGNELVPPGRPVAPHQIRMSNGPALVSMLSNRGFTDVGHEHLADKPDLLKRRLAEHLDEANVLILSGGVSMGKADFVPQALQELGVQPVFHKISQRPGKPMWFGIGPREQAVFALPGNPVSSLICCRQYVLPALLQASGRESAPVRYAILTEDVGFQLDLTCFLPARVAYMDDGSVNATPVPTNTSGDFASLGGTDGYVELLREENEFPAGSVVPLHLWTNP